MSVFDLFRGFFGVPGGFYRGDGRRDPFLDGLLRADDDDDDDDARDPLDEALRFGFSFGPNGTRLEEPRVFGQIFREMEQILAGMSRGALALEATPPSEDPAKGGNSIRDFMLKTPERSPQAPFPSSPFSKFHNIWPDAESRLQPEDKADADLDSRVSSGGLDQILTPEPSQPITRSFFKSVTVTKVRRPDGTVEEKRTVRDGEGNEETTLTISGRPEDPAAPLRPGVPRPSADMQDDVSLFSKFFRS